MMRSCHTHKLDKDDADLTLVQMVLTSQIQESVSAARRKTETHPARPQRDTKCVLSRPGAVLVGTRAGT